LASKASIYKKHLKDIPRPRACYALVFDIVFDISRSEKQCLKRITDLVRRRMVLSTLVSGNSSPTMKV